MMRRASKERQSQEERMALAVRDLHIAAYLLPESPLRHRLLRTAKVVNRPAGKHKRRQSIVTLKDMAYTIAEGHALPESWQPDPELFQRISSDLNAMSSVERERGEDKNRGRTKRSKEEHTAIAEGLHYLSKVFSDQGLAGQQPEAAIKWATAAMGELPQLPSVWHEHRARREKTERK